MKNNWDPINPKDFFKKANKIEKQRLEKINKELENIFKQEDLEKLKKERIEKLNKLNGTT
jgi:hypothetical protein